MLIPIGRLEIIESSIVIEIAYTATFSTASHHIFVNRNLVPSALVAIAISKVTTIRATVAAPMIRNTFLFARLVAEIADLSRFSLSLKLIMTGSSCEKMIDRIPNGRKINAVYDLIAG